MEAVRWQGRLYRPTEHRKAHSFLGLEVSVEGSVFLEVSSVGLVRVVVISLARCRGQDHQDSLEHIHTSRSIPQGLLHDGLSAYPLTSQAFIPYRGSGGT